MMRVAVWLVPLLTLACGGGGQGGDAAAGTDGAGTGAEIGPEVGTQVEIRCDLVSQSGCAADQQCSPFCEAPQLVVGCRSEPAGAVDVGTACSGTIQCKRGSACLAETGMPARCARFCAAATDCAAGQSCTGVMVTYGCRPQAPQPMITIKVCR
jgi:hypothetical protein